MQPQVQAAAPVMPAPPRVDTQPPPPGPPPSYALPAAPLAVAPAADAVARPNAPSGVVAAPAPAPVQAAAPKPVPVAPPSFDADYLHNPTPRYPAAAQRLRESGKVLLSVSVTASGMPERVEIAASSGSPRLDQAALDTVRRWRFVPARQGDQAVAATVTVPLVFRLDE
jgi:protein TonB